MPCSVMCSVRCYTLWCICVVFYPMLYSVMYLWCVLSDVILCDIISRICDGIGDAEDGHITPRLLSSGDAEDGHITPRLLSSGDAKDGHITPAHPSVRIHYHNEVWIMHNSYWAHFRLIMMHFILPAQKAIKAFDGCFGGFFVRLWTRSNVSTIIKKSIDNYRIKRYWGCMYFKCIKLCSMYWLPMV